MKNITYLFLIVLTTITACGADSNEMDEFYPHANQIDTIRHDGDLRTYKLYVPPAYSEGSETSLIIALHGFGNTSTEMEQTSNLNKKADLEGFIVVYPDAKNYPNGDNNTQFWNSGGFREQTTGGTNDVGFISDVIDIIQKHYSINPNQIFATGFSNGGSMCFKLGYELSCKIAAIAPHSGYMNFIPEKPADCIVPLLHVHGTQDGIVPYDSSYVEPVLCVWNSWVLCNQQPQITFENENYLVKKWSNSGNSLYLSKLGRHDWFTNANSGIEVNDVIWEFFKQHPKN